jgi:hypothetical protein
MRKAITLNDEQRGRVELRTALPPLVRYFRDHAHWVPVGFRPLPVQREGEVYRLQLPRFGAMGYELAPEVGLRVIEESERTHRLVSVDQPDLDYRVDFGGVLGLEPADERIGVTWQTRFAIEIVPPAFLRLVPEAALKAAAQMAVSAMIGSVCRALIDNLTRDYRSRPGNPG